MSKVYVIEKDLDEAPRGSYGIYLRLSDSFGIKILRRNLRDAEEVEKSVFHEANEEFNMLEQAYSVGTGRTPQPVGVVIVKYRFQGRWSFSAGIIMEHIHGVRLFDHCKCDSEVAYEEAKKFRAEMHKLGIRHNDLHEYNVMVDHTGKFWMIDISPEFVSVAQRKMAEAA